MSPRCLLFSSDEQASRLLIQALKELELEIEPCPEIFGAVETLTRRSLDVILADLDAGPEANFLLKTARELKLNKDAVVIAVVSGATKNAAQEIGADLVLTKPIIADQVKYALLTCDRFLVCLRNKQSNSDPATLREPTTPTTVMNEPPKPRSAGLSGNLQPTTLAPPPSPIPHRAVDGSAPPLNTTGPVTARLARPYLPAAGKPHPGGSAYRQVETKRNHGKLLFTVALGVVSLAFAYAFTSPSKTQKIFASVTDTYRRVLEKTHERASDIGRGWLRKPEGAKPQNSAVAAQVAQAATFQVPGSFETSAARVRPIPARHSVSAPAPSVVTEEPPAEAHRDQAHVSVDAPSLKIPESIKRPQPEVDMVRVATSKLTLLGELEPVSLSEEASDQLLLEKVQPSYPEQAIKAGLQGAVVLQAWIATDGSIRDLKLVRGPLLLGRAAYQAVKQWRYKPYFRSGKAMEALTYVTVTFTLPQQSLVSPSSR